jgi:hypothetical protein
MMKCYELSLSTNYVASWTLTDAIREIFQNALDAEVEHSSQKMSFNYNEESNVLEVTTQNASLEPDTLLLGVSSKADNSNTIGKFAEGYKLAALVITRLGKELTIYNNKRKELWCPKLVDSKKYTRPILVFYVSKVQTKDTSLVFKVSGITPTEWQDVIKHNLHCQGAIENVISTEKGKILLDKEFKGRIFVNGLWVCDFPEYDFGYDIKPAYLSLDRDRRLVSDFDLQWLASQMWCASNDVRLIDLAEKNSLDVRYLSSHSYSILPSIAEKAFTEFLLKYGPKAIPVSTQEEFSRLKTLIKRCEPIMLGSGYCAIVAKSEKFEAHKDALGVEPPEDPKKLLWEWYLKYKNDLPEKGQNAFVRYFQLL